MSIISTRIQPCLWFDGQAKEAAQFYVDTFPNSRLGGISLYPEAGREHHGKAPGSVMTVAFELDGQPFLALNGGPQFKFTEALSLMVLCKTQEEIDHYWHALSAGGDPDAQVCGWLKDRYGLSWQITPANSLEMITCPDRTAVERYMSAMMSMKKLDLATLQAAFEGR